MRVLITGAGGFVGRYLIAELSGSGDEVIATSRDMTGLEADEVHALDVLDAQATSALIGKTRPDAVVHLAAQPAVPRSWEKPSETLMVNVVGTTHVLEAISAAGHGRLLFIGTGHQYAPSSDPITEDHPQVPTSPYSASKIAAEQIVSLFGRAKGMDVVVARPFNHTGPGQEGEYAVGSFCRQIVAIEKGMQDKVLKVGDLGARRDFLDVRDVVKAYAILLRSGASGQAHNVCSGVAVAMGDVLGTLLSLAGLDGVVEVEQSFVARPNELDVLYGDPGKLRSLGWEPAISMETSLGETLDSYRARNEPEA